MPVTRFPFPGVSVMELSAESAPVAGEEKSADGRAGGSAGSAGVANVNVVLGAGADVVATDFYEEFCKGVSSKSNPKSICWLIGDCWCADAEIGLI